MLLFPWGKNTLFSGLCPSALTCAMVSATSLVFLGVGDWKECQLLLEGIKISNDFNLHTLTIRSIVFSALRQMTRLNPIFLYWLILCVFPFVWIFLSVSPNNPLACAELEMWIDIIYTLTHCRVAKRFKQLHSDESHRYFLIFPLPPGNYKKIQSASWFGTPFIIAQLIQ